MVIICPYCDIEINEKLVEAEDGCCPECGTLITAGSVVDDEDSDDIYDDEFGDDDLGDEFGDDEFDDLDFDDEEFDENDKNTNDCLADCEFLKTGKHSCSGFFLS